ncbi:MAG TPA: polysaccharide deacetylase family protein [Terriglobales bacterium]|jgi:peptidoglycan/xylan/chitin deacetylase (PgdA/CDA1 family)|nr:polysaccharide deacetylase family protein [Terriglobales bacterium]
MSRLFKQGVVQSGVLRWMAKVRSGGVAILMYHSVLEDPKSETNTLGGIMHSSAVFRGQMEVLARYFNPVTLDDALAFVKGAKHLKGRPVVVTFDDGYSDNEKTAIPILNSLGVPATFYVAVESVDSRTLPWPSRLRFAFYTSPKKGWEDGGGTEYLMSDFASRDRAFLRASDECCQLAGISQEQYVQKIEQDLDAAVPASKGNLMMTWDEVRSVARQGHIVGSHTMTHPNMAYIAPTEADRELRQSKARLDEELSASTIHFSYPCPAMSPHWTAETIKQSRECGYATAVTTTPGLAHRSDDPLSLKRVRPSKTVEGLRWNLEAAFAGVA